MPLEEQDLAVTQGMPVRPGTSTAFITLAARIGLLAAIVSWIALDWMQATTPLTLDPSRWYAWHTAVIAGLLVTFIAWGFRAVFGRRPLFSGAWLES